MMDRVCVAGVSAAAPFNQINSMKSSGVLMRPTVYPIAHTACAQSFHKTDTQLMNGCPVVTAATTEILQQPLIHPFLLYSA